MSTIQPSDRIYPLTRLVAGLVVPVLAFAFAILYFYPDQTGDRFAWQIAPSMTAAFMGAGYLGGAYVFLRVALGGPWHRVTHGFPPVAAFTTMMLIATILHWDRFDPGHLPFQLWLFLYAVTPILIPLLWLRNRPEDPGQLEADDLPVPRPARLLMMTAGAIFAAFAAIGLLFPDLLIGIWVWKLTPLTARILAGWFVLLAVGGLTIGRENRWSSWPVGLGAISIWHVLILLRAAFTPTDFIPGPLNWYTGLVFLGVVGMVGLYIFMERRRRSLRMVVSQPMTP